MKERLAILAIGGLLLIGCSPSGGIPEHKKVRNAPTEVSSTGLLVLGAKESDLAELAKSSDEIFIRSINKAHGLFEVHGASYAQVRNAIGPKAKINFNQYRDNRPPPSATGGFNTMSLGFQDDFFADCQNFQSRNPSFQISLQKDLDRFEISHIYELGESVQASFIAKSEHEFLWKLDPPHSSKLRDQSGLGSELEFTPDTNGEFVLTVAGKDELKNCSTIRKSIYVTSNPSFDPDSRLSAAEKSNFDLKGFWHLEKLEIEKAWQTSTGMGIVIAVIDTGVNYNHESLNENIFQNLNEIPGNGIDDDGNGFIDDTIGYDFSSSDPLPFDDNGHGTHVAGLAAASTIGVAKNARIMPLKTLTGLGTDTGSFIGAIYYAVDNGAHIINASFGWKADHPLFRAAMEYARDKGVLVVTAAGNGNGAGRGINNDERPSYPTNYDHPNIISVAATDEDDDLAPYSNFGLKSVDIATYGGTDWLGLYSTAAQLSRKGFSYEGRDGTSQASPLVAGAAALIMSLDPSIDSLTAKSILMSTTDAKNDLLSKLSSGGTMNLNAALETAAGLLSRP